MGYYYSYYYLIIIGLLITFIAQIYVTTTYKKYKRINNKKNLSGFEVAKNILERNNLKDIIIIETKGELTDHYDPTRKVVRLSSDIYNGTTIAAASVAAHECGHVLQDRDGYTFMRIRSAIVPFVNLCSKLGYLAVIIGLIFYYKLAIIGIVLLLAMLLFLLITLPVEFNASKRAIKELNSLNILGKDEQENSNAMLKAAAFTYVASLITTLLQILRLFLMARDRR